MKTTYTVKSFNRPTGTYSEITVKSLIAARKEFMKIIRFNGKMAQILKNSVVIADSHPTIIKELVA